jgi:hypothetical protein
MKYDAVRMLTKIDAEVCEVTPRACECVAHDNKVNTRHQTFCRILGFHQGLIITGECS